MSFNYTVEKPAGVIYEFSLNSNNYYESTNKGVNSSYSLAKLNFTTDGSYKLYLDCINYAESGFDYGILSELDKTLQTNNVADTANVKKSFKEENSTNVQTVEYGQIAKGSHYIYIKFIKDASGNKNNDSLQFKVRTERLPVLDTPTISLNGDNLFITPVSNATSYNIYNNNVLITTNVTSTIVNLFHLLTKSGRYNIVVTAFADGYPESGPSNNVVYDLAVVTLDLTTLNLSAGSYAIRVRAKGEGYLDSQLSNEEVYVILPQLEAPTISLNGSLLTGSAVLHATSYDIYSNEGLLTTLDASTISELDLSNYLTQAGTYTIYAIAKAINYKDSPRSNEVNYTVTPAGGYTLTVVQSKQGGRLDITKFDGTKQEIRTSTTVSNVVSIDNVVYSGDQEQSLSPNISIPFTLTEDMTITIHSLPCFVEGTLITLANGSQKKVEDINYNDKVLTYDFDKGEFTQGDIFWIAKENVAVEYWKITLSDGTELKLVGSNGKSHRLFSVGNNKFLYPQDFTGKVFKENKETPAIVSCEKVNEEVKYYNFLNTHLNCFANGVMVGCRFSNIYPIENMKYVKNEIRNNSLESFKDIPQKYIDGLRLKEQPLEKDESNVNYYDTVKEHIMNIYMRLER